LTAEFGDWNLTQEGYLVQGSGQSAMRIATYPQLPGWEYDASMFKIILCRSHNEMASLLGAMLGFNVVVTVPDVGIIDVIKVESGSDWMSIFSAHFGFWGPVIRVDTPPGGVGAPTIYILDVLNNAGGLTSQGSVNLGQVSQEQISYSPLSAAGKKIEHVIVTGRTDPGKKYLDPKQPDLSPVFIPDVDLEANVEATSDVKLTHATAHCLQTNYAGKFGLEDYEYNVGKATRQKTKLRFHRYWDTSKGFQMVLLSEQTDTIVEDLGTGVEKLTGRSNRFHYYGAGMYPTRNVDEELILTHLPGSSQERLVMVKRKLTYHNHVVMALKQALAQEVTEGLVLYDEVVKNNQKKKDNPNPFSEFKRMDSSRSAVDKSKKTVQRILWMRTNYKRAYINRTSENTLIKTETDFAVLSNHTKSSVSILQNPKAQEYTVHNIPFRREYFAAQAKQIGQFLCRKKSTTVHHDDICTDVVSSAVAARILLRRSGNVESLSIKTSVPIPVLSLPMQASWTPMSISSTTAGGTVTSDDLSPATLEPIILTQSSSGVSASSPGMPANSGYVVGVSERFSMSQPPAKPKMTYEMTLQLRTQL
jgi:hypothetical protein